MQLELVGLLGVPMDTLEDDLECYQGAGCDGAMLAALVDFPLKERR